MKRLLCRSGMLLVLIPALAPVPVARAEVFSFAVIADPHIDANPEHQECLQTAIDWLIANKDDKDIELVFVLGDIAWGATGDRRNLAIAKEMLDPLNDAGIPYVPIIGDNEVHGHCDEEFHKVFGPQYGYLSRAVKNWRKAATPVGEAYLQNFSFDHKGLHFVCPDFISRELGNEGGELHDMLEGSWPWFQNDIRHCAKAKEENILIMTHIGMFRTGFAVADRFLFAKDTMERVTAFLWDYAEYVDTNYSGHIHQNWFAKVYFEDDLLYYARVTDETWRPKEKPKGKGGSDITVRWVTVDNGEPTIEYKQHLEQATPVD